jgi:hypothetical protein
MTATNHSRRAGSRGFIKPLAHRFCFGLCLSLLLLLALTSFGADWIRAGGGASQPVWGVLGGLHFAISPGGFTGGDGGPRGLIRIGYPTLTNGGYDLINFIAIEPIVGGARGYSELEPSHFDGKRGKVFWAGDAPPTNHEVAVYNSGVISKPQPGVEMLTVTVHTEKFDNGAHVRLVLSQRSDAPDELCLTVHVEPDSARIQTCILTATMGNKSRSRLLWLKDETVSRLNIFGDYTGAGFAPQVSFPLAGLPRNAAGDVLVAISNDETNPAAALDSANFWKYRGAKVTQYWRQPAAELNDSLRCAVNARFMYWMSHNPVPGGLAFENFELVEDFRDGQTFIFGVTKRLPSELFK